MAEQTIDKLQVEVEASARGTSSVFKQLESQLTILKKAFEAIDTSKLAKIQKAVNAANPKINTSGMSKAEREIDASIKKIQESMAGLKTYAEKSMSGDKSAFSTYDKQATSLQSTMDKLAEKLKNFGNISASTKAFEKLDSEIESTRSHLEDLKAQEKEALENGGLSDYQMVHLGFAIQETEDKLKSLGAEQDKLINEGKAFYDPFEKYREDLDQLQAKLTDTTTQIQTAMADISNAQPAGTPLDALVEKLQSELPAAISKIQQDFAGLGSYAEAALGGDKSAFTSFERRVTSIQSAIDVVTNKLQQLEGAGVSGEGLEGYRAALQAIQEQLGATSNAVQAAYAQMNNVPAPEVSKEADKASSSMHRLASSRTGLEGLSKALSKIKDHLKGISVHGPNMGKVFKNILKYGFGIRSIYVLFRRLRKAVVESFGELQNSGAFFQTTRANIEALKASLTTLKFQFGAAFEPIFNAVAPALQTLINYLISVMNVISAFTAKLMGKSTYSRAVANMTALGGATGGAAKAQKELNKQLQGFDELNNLTTNNPSGGGGGGGAGDAAGAHYVEESVDSVLGDFGKQLADQIRAGDWKGVGQTISDKLSEAMEGIDWDRVYGKARGFGEGLADFLNGLINPRLFGNVGTTLANSINTAFEFLNSFGTTFDWTNFGTSIGEGISKFFQNADAALWGDTVHTWIAGILDAGIALVDNTDWAEIGTKLGEFLENLDIPDLVKKLGTLAWKLAKGIGEALLNLAAQGEVGAISAAIIAVLGTVTFANKLGGLATKISEALGTELTTSGITIGGSLPVVISAGIAITIGSLIWKYLNGEYETFDDLIHALTFDKPINIKKGQGTTSEGGNGFTGKPVAPDENGGMRNIYTDMYGLTTPELWDEYERDLAEWEKKQKKFFEKNSDDIYKVSAAWDKTKENMGMYNYYTEKYGLTHYTGNSPSLYSPTDATANEVREEKQSKSLWDWLKGLWSDTGSIDTSGMEAAIGKKADLFGKENTYKGLNKSLDTLNKKFKTVGKTQDTFLKATKEGSKTSGKALNDNYNTNAIKPIGEAFKSTYDKVNEIWSKSGDDSKKYANNFTRGFDTMPTETSNRFGESYNLSTGKWAAFSDWVKGKSTTMNTAFDETPTKTSTKFGEAYTQSTNKWATIGDWIKGKANTVNTAFNGTPSAVSSKFATAYTESTNKWSGTSSWIQGIADTIKNKISPIPNNFNTTFEDARLKATSRMVDFRNWFNAQRFEKDAKLNAILPEKATIQNRWNEIANIWKNPKAITLQIEASGSNSFNINDVVGKLNSVIYELNNNLDTAVNSWKQAGMKIKSYSKMAYIQRRAARGGIVDMATPLIAGEAGTEAIVPLQNHTEWLGKMADMMVGEMVKPQHLNIATSIASPYSGSADSSAVAEQNALLREQNSLLREIASKELSIGDREVFNAVRRENSNYINRTGASAFT